MFIQFSLGVSDPKLGGVIQDTIKVSCQSGGVVSEILRGVRMYFHRMVQGLTSISVGKAQLGNEYMYIVTVSVVLNNCTGYKMEYFMKHASE